MAYIGKEPAVGNFQVCDAISVVNGQAAYTMQVSSTNVVPESANHMLVSLNGILQKPNSSFTVSGSTITFASNLATGDVIDFIMLLGNVLDIGTPSDATVTDAKANFVSTSSAAGLQIKGDGTTDGTLQLNCSQNSHGIKLKSPAHSAGASYTLTFPTTDGNADEFLQTNGSGVLTWASAGGGLAVADQWRLHTNFNITSQTTTSLTANLERVDTAGQGYIAGSTMSESSGVFTFPQTGIYLVTFDCSFSLSNNCRWIELSIQGTTNNSSYIDLTSQNTFIRQTDSSTTYVTAHTNTLVDVTDTAQVKVMFAVARQSNTVSLDGNSSSNNTYMTFLRLGDT